MIPDTFDQLGLCQQAIEQDFESPLGILNLLSKRLKSSKSIKIDELAMHRSSGCF